MTDPEMLARDAAEYRHMAPPTAPPPPGKTPIARRVIWGLAFVAFILLGLDGFIAFQLQTSAPQQGAVAAWGAFRVVTVYALARALDEVSRP